MALSYDNNVNVGVCACFELQSHDFAMFVPGTASTVRPGGFSVENQVMGRYTKVSAGKNNILIKYKQLFSYMASTGQT